jgi:hypothetical protein
MNLITLINVTDASEVCDVFIGKLTMCTVNLLIEISGVDEKYSLIFTSSFIKEP